MKQIDFEQEWPQILPHLNNPRVKAALDYGLAGLRYQIACLDESAPCAYADLEHGCPPWSWSRGDYWCCKIDDRVSATGFELDCDPLTDEPTAASVEEYDKLWNQLCPQPDSYEWFQAIGRCHWIVEWCSEIGKLLHPELVWSALASEHHSTAVGRDNNDTILMVSDVLNFDSMSSEEIISFVENGITKT